MILTTDLLPRNYSLGCSATIPSHLRHDCVLHVTPGGIVYTAAQRDRINRTIQARDVSLVLPLKWTPPGGAAPAVAGRV